MKSPNDKQETISLYVDMLADKYEWFCPNSWTMDDVAINFAGVMNEKGGLGYTIVRNLIDGMQQWKRMELAKACAELIQASGGSYPNYPMIYRYATIIEYCVD